jgi:hypothetical protein
MTCAALLFAPVALGQERGSPESEPPAATPAPEQSIETRTKPARGTPLAVAWADRLALLRPGDPDGYFRLGEEVVARASQPADVRLARELFVLAYELDRRTGGRSGLMGASCIALADIAPLRQDRRWLLAMARSTDARYTPAGVATGRHAAATLAPGAASAATALGQTRSGDGAAARQALANPDVLEVLRGYDAALAGGGRGGVERILRMAEAWPCPECRNARVIKLPGSNPARYRVCGTCEGNPGPKLSREELLTLLRVESWILDGEQKTWAAQIAADEGAPLHDPEPAELAPVLGVDASKVYWRGGGWSASG